MKNKSSLLLLGLLACTNTTQLRQDPAAAAGKTSRAAAVVGRDSVAVPFTASVRIEVLEPIGSRTLKPGDKLYPGDQFTITAWTDQPAYLYVLDYEPSGWSQLMFPKDQELELRSQEPLRLPQNGHLYTAKNTPGEFSIKVFASLRPLDEHGCTELRLRCPLWSVPTSTGSVRSAGVDAAEEAKKAEKPTPPPPPPDGPKRPERDGVLLQDQPGYVLSLPANAQGEALLTFRLVNTSH